MACTNHPLVATGISQCWVCARDFCPDCVVEFQSRTMCGPCKAEAVARLEAGQGAVATQGEKAPWERRSELGLVQAWWQTVKGVLSGPTEFFERLDKTVTSYECLILPAVNLTLATISGWLTSVALSSVMPTFLGSQRENRPSLLMFQGVLGGFYVLAAPLLAVILMLIWSGSAHLILAMMKKATVPFHQTLRGWCYASCPLIIGVIPLVGGVAGHLWCLVVYILMVMRVHRVSGGVAALAALALPGLFFCCCGGLAAIGIFAAAAARH